MIIIITYNKLKLVCINSYSPADEEATREAERLAAEERSKLDELNKKANVSLPEVSPHHAIEHLLSTGPDDQNSGGVPLVYFYIISAAQCRNGLPEYLKYSVFQAIATQSAPVDLISNFELCQKSGEAIWSIPHASVNHRPTLSLFLSPPCF